MVVRALHAAAFIGVTLILSADARADGGAVRMQATAVAFTLTLFTPPDPVAAGTVDVSVFVQDHTGAPLLDGLVNLRLTRDDRVIEATATHDVATNKLLYAAPIDVDAGQWRIDVVVRRDDETASMNVPLSIGPATTRLGAYWPHLLLPLIAIVVFVLHQCLVESRRSLA